MSAPMIHRPVMRLDDHATREQIAEVIADLRARAVRYSRHDPRRAEIDDEVDVLVDEWIEAGA